MNKTLNKQLMKKSYPLKEDVESIEGIMNAYYEVVSGAKGEPRQTMRDKSLHHPNAFIAYTGQNNEGKSYIKDMTLNEFHQDTKPYDNGFFESENHRVVHQFGNIAHVWSTYETRFEEKGEVKRRGINSIQLYNDGTRWWITSWMFDGERANNPIPEKYLK